MAQWEYKTAYYPNMVKGGDNGTIYMTSNPMSEEDMLNELGIDGWELVSVVTIKTGIWFYLKRKIS